MTTLTAPVAESGPDPSTSANACWHDQRREFRQKWVARYVAEWMRIEGYSGTPEERAEKERARLAKISADRA